MVALFEREDWELFGSLVTLAQKAGVPQRDLVAVAAKELADNALDAGAHVDVGLCAPDGFYVTDDGPGLPDAEPAEIARLFSIGRPLVSSKLWRLPTRGALGNGLRVVAGLVLATVGRLTVTTRGMVLELTPRTDGHTDYEVVGTASDDAGTRVEVHLGSGYGVGAFDLVLAWDAARLARCGPPYKGKSSPHWYDVESFSTLLRAAGQRPVRDVLAELDGCSGGKAGQIAASFKGRSARSLSRDEAERLLAAALLAARPVVPARLGVIGPQEDLGEAYAVAYGEFTLPPAGGTLEATIPFVAEVWMESIQPYMRDPDGGKAGDRRGIPCHLCVNKTPVTQAVTARYNAKDKEMVIDCGGCYIFAKVGREPPWRIWINVQTPYMPIISDGKAPDLRYVRGTITVAAEKAGRQIARACPPAGRSGTGGGLTVKEITLAHLADGIAKVSTGGQHRFAQRQLFYVIRPFIAAATGKEPKYDTFAGNLTDYETEHGPIRGMYRDTRGTIYHPHTGEEIAVGTLSVEDYTRPPLTFNKIVYIEKEGLFPVLKAEQWPERHDCALITSKGQASRAAKDLIDLLVATSGDEEDLEVYCVHDADAAGTMIYQALQEETRTRPGRRVKIHNLGLDPWEAVALGLDVEPATYEKRQPVADYIKEHTGGEGINWEKWLQTHRVELNSMTTEQLLAWLDGKMADHAGGKVVPPHATIAAQLAAEVRAALDATITKRVLAEANIPGQVDAAFAALGSHLATLERRDLPAVVAARLAGDLTQSWRTPVAQLASDVCRLSPTA